MEVLEGQVRQKASNIFNEDALETPQNQLYKKHIDSGWSIGVEKRGSGTLGGFVKLRDPQTGRAEIYGLTNYNVIRPPTKDFEAATDDGTKVTWPAQPSKVKCPSQGDHDLTIQHLEHQIKIYEERFDRLQTMETASSSEKRRIENEAPWRRILNERLTAAYNVNSPDELDFGKVAFSSGYRTAENAALDWALVSVTAADRVGINRVSSQSPFAP